MKRHASMNRIYRLVWNQVLNAWVAVAETSRGRGKSSSRNLIAAVLSLTAAVAQAAPVGGQVVAGAGSISQSTTAASSTTTIQQSSQNLSLNWQSFNIAPQETVNFVQPSATAIAVNRIFDTNGTQILGHLNANGQVYLINPNGILFGQGAQVNVGGLVASTLDLNDASLNGNARSFRGNGSGSVVNEGMINAANGGYVALLGNHVRNQGTISAQLGTVALGAGSAATLTFSGNSLVQMQVDQSTLNNLSENGGLIRADGGMVVMSAGAKDALLASVVNNTGVIEARTVENHEGVITLLGGMAAGTVNVRGTLDASSTTGQAGRVVVTGEHVLIDNGARIDATGATGGGEVNVGGGWQGNDASIANASAVVMRPGAVIDVSATESGNGGTSVLWSKDYTGFYGNIAAKGGKDSGNGGNVETSSHNNLQALGTVNAANWLLDPSDVIISTGPTVGDTYANTFTPTQDSTILASSIVGALNSGNNVTITTGTGGSTGNITVSAPIAVTGGSAPTLTLQAANDINVIAAISSSNSRLNVILSADSDISGAGSVNFSAGGSITSHGGNVGIGTVSGGTIVSMGQNVTMTGGSFIDVGMPGVGMPGYNYYNISGNLGISVAGNITLAANSLKGLHNTYYYYAGGNDFNGNLRYGVSSTYISLTSSVGAITTTNTNAATPDILTSTDVTLSAGTIGAAAAGQAIKISAPADFLGRITNPLNSTITFPSVARTLTLTNTVGSSYVDEINQQLFSAINVTIGNQAATQNIQIKGDAFNTNTGTDQIFLITDGATLPLASGAIKTGGIPGVNNGYPYNTSTDTIVFPTSVALQAAANNITLADNAVNTGGVAAYFYPGSNYHQWGMNTYAAIFSAATTGTIQEPGATTGVANITTTSLTLSAHDIGTLANPLEIRGGKDERGNSLTLTNTGGSTYIDSLDNSFTTISLTNVKAVGADSIHFSGGDFIDYTTDGSAIILPTIATSGDCAGRTDCGVRVSQGVRSINLTANSGDMTFASNAVQTGGGYLTATVNGSGSNMVLTGTAAGNTAVGTGGGSFIATVNGGGDMTLGDYAVDTGNSSFTGTASGGTIYLGDYAVANTNSASFTAHAIDELNTHTSTPQITADQVTLQGVNIGLVDRPVNVSGGTNLTVNNTGGSTYVDSTDNSFTTISLTNVKTAGSHSIHFNGGDFIDYTTNGSAIVLPTIATSGACAGRTDCGVRVSQGIRSINLTANSGGMLFDTGSVNTGGGSFSGYVYSGNMQVNQHAVLTGGGSFSGTVNNGSMTLDDTAVDTGGGSFYGQVTSGNMILNNNAVLTGGGSFNGNVYTSGNMTLGDNAVDTTNGSNNGGGSFYGYVSNGNIGAANVYAPGARVAQITAGDVTLTDNKTAGTIGGGGNDIQIARAGTVDNNNTLTVNTYQGNVNVQELTHNHFKTINVTLNGATPAAPQTIDIGLNGGVDVVNFSDSGTVSTSLITLNNTNLKLADYNRNWRLYAPYRAILIDSTANGSGYYDISTTHNITTTAPVTTTGGYISMSGGNDGTGINLGGNVVSNGGAITLYGYGAAGLNLNGDVLSNGGSITLYGAGGINLLKSVDISSSNSSGGGSIQLNGGPISSVGGSYALTVDSSSTGSTGGPIYIQNNMGHAAGDYLSGLTVTAAGANLDGSQDGTIYFQGTSYLLNGSFSSTGNTWLWNGGAQTIDTEQGNLASAGNITFSGYGLQTYPSAPLVLDASTGANGFNGGNVDLYSGIHNPGISLAGLTINTTGGGSGGTDGYINLPAVSTTYSGYSYAQSYTGDIITLHGDLLTDKGAITLTGDTRLASSVTLRTWVNDTNVQNGTAGAVTIDGTGVSATGSGYDLTINAGTDTGSNFYNGDQNFTHNAGNVSIIAGNAGGAYVNNLVVNTSTGGDHNTSVTKGTIALNTVGTEGTQTYIGGATTVSGSLTTNGGNIDLAGVESLALLGDAVTFSTDRIGGNGDAGSLLLGAHTLNGAVAVTIDTTADNGGAGTDLTLTSVGAGTPLSSLNASARTLTVDGAGVFASGDIVLNAGTTIGLGASVSSAGAITLNHGGALTQTAGTVDAPTLKLNGLGAVGTSDTPLATSAATIILNKADAAGATFVHDTSAVAVSGITGGSLVLHSDSDITVDTSMTLATTGANNGSITLQADNNITLAEGASITTQGYAVTLNSDRDANGVGNIQMNHGTSITSNGGNITLGGGANPLTTAAVGSDTNGTDLYGVYLNDATLNAGAGNISIIGTGIAGTSLANGIVASSPSGGTGGTVIQTTSGNITLNGTGGAGVDGNNGVLLTGTGTNITSATGAISLTGQGAGEGAYNLGIEIRFDAAVTSTGAATITLNGTGGAGTDANSGVMLHSNANVTSSDGAISIIGRGAGSGGQSYGILMGLGETAGAAVTSTGAATITLNGTGGAGTDNNYGVYLSDAGTIITSATGAISIIGQSEGTGQANYGIFMNAGAAVTSTDTATITLSGTGGAGEYDNYGVYLSGADTNITSAIGPISIIGKGAGIYDYNYGISMDNGAAVTSTDTATITLNGTGGAGTDDNYGVYLSGAGTNITSSNGAISITGQGAGTGQGNYGIFMDGEAAITSTDTATITLDGRGAGDAEGIYTSTFGANNNTIGGATSTGNITLIADTATGASSIYLSGLDIFGTGNLVLQPLNPTTTIGLAGGAGTFNLDASELSTILSGFASITIGHENGTGLISFGDGSGAGFIFNANTTLRNPGVSSGGMTIIDSLSVGVNNLTLNSAGTVDGTLGTINAAGLELLGTGGTHTLTNTGNAITTLAGNTGTVNYQQAASLVIGSVGATTGLTAANGLLVRTTGDTADLTLTNGVTADSAGDALVLAAGRNFFNNFGPSALAAPNGRWLVYSTSPADSYENGLTAVAGSSLPRFYNKTYVANSPATIAAGNHLLYSTQPTLTVTADNQTHAYGDANAPFAATITGFVSDDGVTDTTITAGLAGAPAFTSLATATSAVSGSPFAITATAGTLASSAGYNFGFADGVLTVTARPVTVMADPGQTKVYGNADPGAFTFTTTSLGGGIALSGSLTRVAGETVLGGPYAITQGTLSNANNSNYSLTYTGNALTINPATLTVTADPTSRLYGAANPALSGSVTGFVNGELLANVTTGTESFSSSATNSSNVGSYGITGAGLTANNGNYVFSQAAGNATALTINKAHLTVTADDKSRLYGAANPILTTTVSGFVNGETAGTAAGFGGSGSATTLANASTAVGSAAITANASTLEATNYDFTHLVDGTLTINPATLTVKPVTPPEPVKNAIAQLESNILAPRASTKPEELSLSPTITVTQSSSPDTDAGGDASSSGSGNSSPDGPRWRVAIDGGDASSSGSDNGTVVNTTMNIGGGTGPSLQVVNGGMKLPDNIFDMN